jgi:hypothetical protein
MTKRLFVAALAVFLWMPHASGQSILQRSDWQERRLETYLPLPGPTVPWLHLNTRTKLPKGDLPLGRDTASVGHLVLPFTSADTQLSSNVRSTSRSM